MLLLLFDPFAYLLCIVSGITPTLEYGMLKGSKSWVGQASDGSSEPYEHRVAIRGAEPKELTTESEIGFTF